MDNPLFSGQPLPALPVGLTPGSIYANDQIAPQRSFNIGGLRELGGLSREYAFYTPALLHLHAQLTFDPLSEFLKDYKQDVPSLSLTFDTPLFFGLALPDDKSWNHVLFAMPHDYWPDYQNWLRSLALLNRAEEKLSRVRVSPLEIADPLWLQHATIVPLHVPKITVHALCIETNKDAYYLSQPLNVLSDVPRALRILRVYKDTIEFASDLLEGRQPTFESYVPEHNLEMPEPLGWDAIPWEHQQDILKSMRLLKGSQP